MWHGDQRIRVRKVMALVDKLKQEFCLVALLFLPINWSVAQKPLKLVSMPQIRNGVAALPRIAAPNAAETKINAALERQDLWARKTAEGCSEPDMYWERTVEVTKSGPALLSVLVSDSADCGGVHPFNLFFPLVYDLRTGDAVKWSKVFPKGRTEEVTSELGDGMPIIIIRSKDLQAFYLAHYQSRADCSKEDVAGMMSQFLLYPDDKANALEIFPSGVPQVALDCADSLSLDAKTLASLKVSQQWRDAILSQNGKP
jgi:hypothetical protein